MLKTLVLAGVLACASAVVAAGRVGGGSGAVTRIYIEPLPIKSGSEKLQSALIAQLKKLRSVSVVADAAASDARLNGDGEVWIKGYQSLNPRSGRMPSNGTAIYGGFLSVELTDAQGDTQWSYLASENSAEDIFGALAKQVAQHLADALQSRSGP
jgi:hypothetical protein